jgi:HEAT repeat protein
MSEPLRRGSSAALALFLAWGTGASASPAAPTIAATQEPSTAEQACRLLGQPGANGESLSSSLVALGPAAIWPLIDALRDESVLASDSGGRVRLEPATLLAVHKALSRFGSTEVVPCLRGRIAGSAGPDDRRVVIEILGSLGGTEDLDLLFDAASPPEDGTRCDSRSAKVTQRALEQIFARCPSALEPAAKRLPHAHEELAPALARAIGSSGSPTSFDLLAWSLGQSPTLDLIVLPNLSKAEGRTTSPQRGRVLERVRADLASSNRMLARTAAMVCGELDDPLSAPALCELLEGPDAQLAASAHASLKKLSGLGFPAQRSRWRQWLQAEESWYASEAELAIGQLQSPDVELVLRALQALVQHPLYRDTFAPSVACATSRSEPGVRCFACTVLGRWRWSASIPVLRELARDRSLDVAKAATDALRAIDPSLTVTK